MKKPFAHYFFSDDGIIPNSQLPVLVYWQVVTGDDRSSWLENQFKANNWTNNWRDIVLSYDHFHSTTHEVLGVGKGSVTLQIGGKNGLALTVFAGDVLIIPAGVGHYALEQDEPYEIIGGYPNGLNWDLIRGSEEERREALPRIAQLALPDTDPIFGADGALLRLWSSM